ncbi:MAG TPA: glycoside hydrolase [Lachnospiraceae bacterium]|nr:glycoside hydrolase [Lachnospiraceae bacterium]
MTRIRHLNIRLFIMILFLLSFLAGCNNSGSSNALKPEDKIDNVDTKTEVDKGDHDGNENNGSNKEETLLPEIHYGNVQIDQKIVFHEGFESGDSDFYGRGTAEIEMVSGKAYEGSNALLTSGRTDFWNGPIVDLTNILEPNSNYVVKAYIMYEDGPDSIQMDCMLEKNESHYLKFGSALVEKGVWTELNGRLIVPEDTKTVKLYFETNTESEKNCVDFYIDGVELVKETAHAVRGDIPSLKEIYKDYFTIGFATTVYEASESRQGLMTEQFSSFTIGNELKPDSLLDYEKSISDPKYDDNPQVTFKNVEYLLEFAKKANLPLRGHTLVWHSQTPRWLFTEGYSKGENAPLVSKELMLKRLENYIKNVLSYLQTNYPGVIYCWDVVNEAIEVGDGEPGFYRSKESYWYQIIGPEFVEKAFEYARKYADPEVKLFYNDYNTEQVIKMNAIIDLVQDLKSKGLIDGIGLQSHIGIDSPSIADIENSIRKYAELGLEIHITELDMYLTDNSEEAFAKQASRYKRLFLVLQHLKKQNLANITNVTFWGLSDETSWLNKPSVPNYPLLFDKYLIQKPAFWGVVMHPDIPLN